MPADSGVDDLVAGIEVLRSILKALSEGTRSSEEYFELVAELWGLESALTQVKILCAEVNEPAQLVALQQAVEFCSTTLDEFLTASKNDDWRPSIFLAASSTSSTWEDRARGVPWHLTRKDEIAAFTTSVGAHIHSMQTLLFTIQE